jgi:sulfoxide reductase heme-binding subunit YedZ
MGYFKHVTIGTWLCWITLSIPMFWLALDQLINGLNRGKVFYWTGVFSMIFILVSLAVTPLRRIFRGAHWVRWLSISRRYIGVAGFAYAAIHTLVWLVRNSFWKLLVSFTRPDVLLGWLGFFILVALAVTSNDRSVRQLGPRWKSLHKWVYIATSLALLHWFMASNFRMDYVAIYGGTFVVLMIIRIAFSKRRA